MGWPCTRRAMKPKHDRAGAVDPLHVVDQQQHRCLVCDRHDERQGGVADQQRARWRAGPEPERHRQRVARSGWKAVQLVAQREQQLVQPGVADVRLELRTRGAQHAHARRVRLVCRGVEQGGLADAGFAADEPGVATVLRLGDEARDPLQLDAAPEQFRRAHTHPSR